MADIFLYPALVQGNGAEESLIRALDYLDSSGICEVIIIGRGGGSIEDLWAFNSEKLARRIYNASTPIISAVGHETDFTICDFVSDMRAPTPSAAAEIAVPDRRELQMQIDSLDDRLYSALNRRIVRAKERLALVSERASADGLLRLLSVKDNEVNGLCEKAHLLFDRILKSKRENLMRLAAEANALSPLATLYRGYSVAERNGKVVKGIKDLASGDKITLIMSDGRATAKVTEIKGD